MITIATKIEELDEQVIRVGYAKIECADDPPKVNFYGEEMPYAWDEWEYVVSWDEADEAEAILLAAKIASESFQRYDDGGISFIVTY